MSKDIFETHAEQILDLVEETVTSDRELPEKIDIVCYLGHALQVVQQRLPVRTETFGSRSPQVEDSDAPEQNGGGEQEASEQEEAEPAEDDKYPSQRKASEVARYDKEDIRDQVIEVANQLGHAGDGMQLFEEFWPETDREERESLFAEGLEDRHVPKIEELVETQDVDVDSTKDVEEDVSADEADDELDALWEQIQNG